MVKADEKAVDEALRTAEGENFGGPQEGRKVPRTAPDRDRLQGLGRR